MSGPTVIDGLDELRAAVGRDLGATGWRTLTDAAVADFARSAGHGDLTWLVLSLTNLFLPDLLEVRGISAGVNYGTEAVRFPTTVEAGDRLRGRAVIEACDEVKGGVQTTIRIEVEREGDDAPACVVESLSRWLA